MTGFRSVPDMFLHRVDATPDRIAFLHPVESRWEEMTWREAGERVRAIAGGLRALGLENEHRCAILSNTRVEWLLVDLGILGSGGATTTIYPSNTADDCSYILNDSETRFVFAEDDDQVQKLLSRRSELVTVKNIVVIDGRGGQADLVMTLDDLMDKGRAWNEANPGRYEEIGRSLEPSALATLIYTSGTTGKPKGVELVHDCWVFEGEAIDEMGIIRPEDVQYLWLPLAHSFGKVLEAALIKTGCTTAVDGRLDKLVDNLAVVRPTFVAAVPRIFEKVHNKVVGNAREGGGLKLKIFNWAIGVGRVVSGLRQQGREPTGLLKLKHTVADKLVFSKLKARFGGRLKYFVSGAAPLARELSEFFHAADVLILEGYGLTETSAASFVNRPDHYKFGTVGPPLPGVEVKIAEEDGEVLIKGRGVMRGYRGLPEATAEALDADGWMHTGDIGELDDGFLRITDRKKDLIKTSGGKYVAPQALEGRLKALCPLISQVLVHGNNRNFCTALVSLDEEAARAWAGQHGVTAGSYAELAASPRLVAAVQECVDKLNAGLASYETIKKFALLPADLTQEAGDLTPTQKVKRKAVEQKYKALLDSFYANAVQAL